jgi:hypothetical protein
MVARITGITEFSAATAFMTNYSFGGIAWIAALILGASYFATNDSNLFASVQACEGIKDLPHKVWFLIMTATGAITAFLLSISGAAKSLESIASLKLHYYANAYSHTDMLEKVLAKRFDQASSRPPVVSVNE